MKSAYLSVALTSVLLLTACGQKKESKPAPTGEASATESAAALAKMAMPTEDAKMGKSTGTVIAINQAAGSITLAHEAIPQVGWSAMTMSFTAKPDLLTDVVVGDKVAFNVTVKGNSGEITAISKR